MKIGQGFYPDEWTESVNDIDFESYYKKGYRGIVFDIDNTLVPHGMPSDEETRKLIGNLSSMGFKICIVSNNERERVESFCESLKVMGVWKAHKPDTKGYHEACGKMSVSPANVLCVGDQLITDIRGGNRSGMHTILVNPITRAEEIQVVVKRKLEAPFIFLYRLKLKMMGKKYPKRRLPEGKAVITDNMGRPIREKRKTR